MTAEETPPIIEPTPVPMEPVPFPMGTSVVPQLGLPTDKSTLDVTFGRIALAVRDTFNDILSSKARLDSLTEQDLTDRGYTLQQIAQLRSAWNDLNKIVQVFYGEIDSTPAYDYSTFVRFLWGFGV